MNKKPTMAQLEAEQVAKDAKTQTDSQGHPVPQHLMDGLAETYRFGTGLELEIKALPIRYQRKTQQDLYMAFPATMIAAAVGDRTGKGINYPVTALQYTLMAQAGQDSEYRAALDDYEQRCTEATGPVTELAPVKPEPATSNIDDVAADFRDINNRLVYESMDENDKPGPIHPMEEELAKKEGREPKRLIDAIAAAVYPLAKETPGLDQASLSALIENHLNIEDMVDLLRACLNAYGNHPGCMADRFTVR